MSPGRTMIRSDAMAPFVVKCALRRAVGQTRFLEWLFVYRGLGLVWKIWRERGRLAFLGESLNGP